MGGRRALRSFELRNASHGVRVTVVEPGVVNTDFGGRSFDYSSDEALEEYKGIVDALENAMSSSGTSSEPSVVAEVIYQAVTDDTNRLRYTAGTTPPKCSPTGLPQAMKSSWPA